MQFSYDAEIEKYVTQVEVDTDAVVENRVSLSKTPADVLARIKARDAFYVKCGYGHFYTFVE